MKYLYRFIVFGFLWILLSLFPQNITAQTGADFKFGPVILQTNSEKFSTKGEYHNGWQIGIKARFGGDKIYFNPGFFYRSIQLVSSAQFNPFEKGVNMTIFNFPADVGFRLVQNPTFSLRLFAGASINYIQSIEENSIKIDIEDVNDIHMGGDIGLGFDLYWFTFDIAYEKGFLDVFRNESSSKGDYATISFGFFF